MPPPRVAVLCDFAEEGWPSMEAVANGLLSSRGPNSPFQAVRIQPAMRRFPVGRPPRCLFNLERLANRMWSYPRYARSLSGFDLFHIVDHSYAQLVHRLSAAPTVVTCHDTDTFRCLFEPTREPRSYWFRTMVRHTLRGLEKAAAVVCVSAATRDRLLQFNAAAPERIRVIPNGIDRCFRPDPDPVWDSQARRLLGRESCFTDLLHVGSSIPRKRIDVLLRVFAECRKSDSRLRLLRVGSPFTPAQQDLLSALRLESHVLSFPFLDRRLLAAFYRRAALLLLPSESEGFGLPLAEAMASGAPVLASDIPAFREVAATAAEFRPCGAIEAWAEAVSTMLRDCALRSESHVRRVQTGLARSAEFSWDRALAATHRLYRDLLSQPLACSSNRNLSQ